VVRGRIRATRRLAQHGWRAGRSELRPFLAAGAAGHGVLLAKFRHLV
jgi:hypothetical protein